MFDLMGRLFRRTMTNSFLFTFFYLQAVAKEFVSFVNYNKDDRRMHTWFVVSQAGPDGEQRQTKDIFGVKCTALLVYFFHEA